MSRRLLVILASVFVLFLLVAAVIFLRTRGIGEAGVSLSAPSRGTPAVSAKGSGVPERPDLNAQELKTYYEMQALENSSPTNVRDTWTPEFKAKVESQSR